MTTGMFTNPRVTFASAERVSFLVEVNDPNFYNEPTDVEYHWVKNPAEDAWFFSEYGLYSNPSHWKYSARLSSIVFGVLADHVEFLESEVS